MKMSERWPCRAEWLPRGCERFFLQSLNHLCLFNYTRNFQVRWIGSRAYPTILFSAIADRTIFQIELPTFCLTVRLFGVLLGMSGRKR